MRDNKLLGALGEDMARALLYSEGYTILERNFRSYRGEIDIICEKNGTMCFVEVKTRTGDRFGDPYDAVDWKKKEHMKKAAEYYMMKTRYRGTPSFKVMEIVVRTTDDDFMFF